jgi:hypothetical protein
VVEGVKSLARRTCGTLRPYFSGGRGHARAIQAEPR